MSTTRGLRPVGVVVWSTVVCLLGSCMIVTNAGYIRTPGADDAARSYLFLLSGLAALAGGYGAWVRATWATRVLAIWVVSTVIAMPIGDADPVGYLPYVLLIGGSEAALVWYLDRWIRT